MLHKLTKNKDICIMKISQQKLVVCLIIVFINFKHLWQVVEQISGTNFVFCKWTKLKKIASL